MRAQKNTYPTCTYPEQNNNKKRPLLRPARSKEHDQFPLGALRSPLGFDPAATRAMRCGVVWCVVWCGAVR